MLTRRLLGSVTVALACSALATSLARAQFSSRFDLGSGVQRESENGPLGTPLFVAAGAAYDARWGSIAGSALMLDGVAHARDDRRLAATFASTRLRGFGIDATGLVTSMRLPLQSSHRRSQITAGPSFALRGLTASVHVSRAVFGEALAIPSSRETHASIAYDFGPVALGVEHRGVQYREIAVTTVVSTSTVAGFPFHTMTERFDVLPRRYADLEGSVDVRVWRVMLSGRGGLRSAAIGLEGERWGSVGVEIPVVRRVSLRTEIGRAASTPEQALPRYPFVRVGLRLAHGTRPRPERDDAPLTSADREVLDVTRTGDASVVRLRGVQGTTVELTGDFSDWQSVPLVRERDGVWRLDHALAPGAYRVMMRIDGGDWRVPPSVAAVRSEYGELVGFLVVER